MRRWSLVHLKLLKAEDSRCLCYWHELLQQLWDHLSKNRIYFHAAVWAVYQILQMYIVYNGSDFVQAFLKWLNYFWMYNWITMFYNFLQIWRGLCLSEEQCNNDGVCKAAAWRSQVFFWEYKQLFLVVIQQEFWLFNYSISGYWLGTDRETCVWTGIQ